MTLSDLLQAAPRPLPARQWPDYIRLRLRMRKMLVGNARMSGEIDNLLFRYTNDSIVIWSGRDFMHKRLERSKARHYLRPQFYEDEIQQL